MVSTTRVDTAGARGEGLEPSITGPEPVVLPITPPPNGWAFRLPERPMAGVRPDEGPRARPFGRGAVERCVASGCPGSRPGSEVLGMRGWSRAGVALVGAVGAAVFALPAPAG